MKTKKVKKIESKHIYEKIYEYKNMDAMKRFFYLKQKGLKILSKSII